LAQGAVPLATENGDAVMVRSATIMIAITLVAASMLGAPAAARGGFGGGGFSHSAGFGHPAGIGHPMAHGSSGNFGHPIGFTPFVHAHPFAFHDHRFAFRHRFFRHHFFGPAFAFVGAPFASDDCFVRVWTRWGWRWVSLCD
jgi:hypothetical protein